MSLIMVIVFIGLALGVFALFKPVMISVLNTMRTMAAYPVASIGSLLVIGTLLAYLFGVR